MTLAKQQAFLDGMRSGKFQTTMQRIYNLLNTQSQTLESIAAKGFRIQTASARISDLMDMGLVEASGADHSVFHVVTDPARQLELIREREAVNFHNWKARGIKMDWFSRYKDEICYS